MAMYFNLSTFKDESRCGPIVSQEFIDAVHHYRHQIKARGGDFYIEEEHRDFSPSNRPVEQLFEIRKMQLRCFWSPSFITKVRTKLCDVSSNIACGTRLHRVDRDNS